MSNVGSRVDWGGEAQKRRLDSSSFSGLLSRNKSPRSRKNNNKDTGFVVRGGGSAGSKAAGLDGLKVTRVERPLNLRKGVNQSKVPGANTRRNQSVTKGGGHPSRSIVQAKVRSVKVKPEC